MKIYLYIIYAISNYEIHSSILVKETQRPHHIIHERLEKSKVGAVIYTTIPFGICFIIALIINIYFAYDVKNTTKKMMKCIVTTFLVFGIDVIIKLFINYYGPLSFFFKPLTPLYFISCFLFNLFFSPVFILLVLILITNIQITNMLDIILPGIEQKKEIILEQTLLIKFIIKNSVLDGQKILMNRLIIFIIIIIYVLICNIILPLVLQSQNKKKNILYKNNQLIC